MWRGAGPTVARAAVGAMTELPVYDEVKSAAIKARQKNQFIDPERARGH